MGLQADFKADNGVAGNYFTIVRGVLVVAQGTPVPLIECTVNFYESEELRRVNSNPMRQYLVNVPLTDLPFDVRDLIYPALKNRMEGQIPGFKAAAITDVLHDTPFTTLDEAKASKKAEITYNKIKANRDYFMFKGYKIQADDASMLEIQTTMNGVLARGALREDWPGGWTALDNRVVPIPDVATWYAFYAAIEETGQANFNYSRALKALVDTCTTFEQVRAIAWGIDPSTFKLPIDPASVPGEPNNSPVV